MHRLVKGVLIFVAGWGLGWYMFQHRATDSLPSMQTAAPPVPGSLRVQESPANFTPAQRDPVDSLAEALERGAFDAAVGRYEALQAGTDKPALADAKAQILAHARALIAGRRFGLAVQLLQRFLLAEYHDVEARVLLAEALRGQEDYRAAIDQLYEARGYAFRPDTLARISGRIRALVAELSQLLEGNGDRDELLALYQHLTQLEPGHAPWFMGLAAAQLALDDSAAAYRSLLLVSNDPDVGAEAQALLAELDLAQTQQQDAEPRPGTVEIVGIPLHRSGNHFIVDAQASNGGNLRLLIDTGASLTMLSSAALERRGVHYKATGRSGVFNTANGQVRAPIIKLDSLLVGDWQVTQLEVGVLDLGGRSDIDGLLGMNFLRHFQFFIDQNESSLRLTVN